MGTTAVAAVIRRKEREVIRAFRNAGATTPERAAPLSAVDPPEGLGMRRLTERAVVRQASPGMYYLDEEVWAAVRRTRHRLMLVVTIIMAVLLIGLWVGVINV